MPSDNSMPRNPPNPAPGEDKRPLVPEVSLLLDQAVVLNTERNIRNHLQIQEQGEVFHNNQFESYNTWKAKNAQTLHKFTSSAGRERVDSKHTTASDSSRQSSGSRRKPTDANEFPNSQRAEVTSHLVGRDPNEHCMSRQVIRAEMNVQPTNSQNLPQRLITQDHCSCNSNQQCPVCMNKPEHNRLFMHNNYVQVEDPESYRLNQIHGFDYNFAVPRHRMYSNVQTVHTPKFYPQGYAHKTSTPYVKDGLQNITPHNCGGGDCQAYCPPGQESGGASSSNGTEFLTREPEFLRDGSNKLEMLNAKVASTLNTAQVKTDLYNTMHVQTEQILILQQQMNQVLQVVLDCDRTLKQKLLCHNCSCGQKNNQACGNDSTNDCKEANTEDMAVEKRPLSSNTGTSKKSTRSIGVMTSPAKQNGNICPNLRCNFNGNTKSKTCSSQKPESHTQGKRVHNSSKSQNQQQNERSIHSPSPTPPPPKHQKDKRLLGEEKRKAQQTPRRKTKKSEPKACSQTENSFTLNEAEILIISDEQAENISPTNSVHVDLPDYSNSSSESIESDGTESSSGQDDGDGSESDRESSDPPLGWTFYNGVVGQVNDILEKTTPPQQRPAQTCSKTPTHHAHKGDGAYETVNNWSKRVTFNGPPLEDSDNNLPRGMQVPVSRFQQCRPNQDLRTNGGPDMMQDFMMYNVVNGSTNHSIATLRYLERYNLLLPQQNLQMPDVYHGYQRSDKHSKRKKNKSKTSETPQQNSRNKASVRSSKLLDITALKQQPKLF